MATAIGAAPLAEDGTAAAATGGTGGGGAFPGKQHGASSSARVTIRCGDGGASSAGQPRRGGSSEGCRGVDCRLLCRLLPVRGGGACLKQSKALKYSIAAMVCAALGAQRGQPRTSQT